MITLMYGQVGSGKTASMVYDMLSHPERVYFTNIDTFKAPHIHRITPEQIIKKEDTVSKTGKVTTKLTFNTDYWKDVSEKHNKIYVVIDEAHTFFNPRRSMSKLNILMNDFLSLLRRVVGGVGTEKGELILITQLSRRLDVVAKEMSRHVVYCVNHQKRQCRKCGYTIAQHNEKPEQIYSCIYCNEPLKIIDHCIERYHFVTIDDFEKWQQFGVKSYYKRELIPDIEKTFKYYNTIQWEDFFSEYL